MPYTEDSKRVNVNEILDFSLQLLSPSFRAKNIILLKKFEKDTLFIYANPDKLQQVFLNILLNALDAVQKSGKIWVETIQRNKGIQIIIRDSGPGISNEVRTDIFKAFFTTKGIKGSGLGLYVSYEVINSLGGDISISKWKEGEGAEFVINITRDKEERNYI